MSSTTISADPKPKPAYRCHPPATWNNARRLYITGEANIPQISELTKIPEATLYTRMTDEKWGDKRRAYLAQLEALPITPPTQQQATSQPEPDDHRARRLLRVREQLDRVDSMLATETDPRRMRDLAAVASDLEEQERRLSNRSLPPTLKAPARQRSRAAAPGPLDA